MKITDLSAESKNIQITTLSDSEALKVSGGQKNGYHYPITRFPIWFTIEIPKPISSPANYNGEAPRSDYV